MEKTFIIRSDLTAKDIDTKKIVKKDFRENEIMEHELNEQFITAVKEFEEDFGIHNIQYKEEDNIHFQYNGEKKHLPESKFYQYIRKLNIQDLLKIKAQFKQTFYCHNEIATVVLCVKEKCFNCNN